MTATAARPPSRTVARRRNLLRCACGAVLGEWLDARRFAPSPGVAVIISLDRHQPSHAGHVTCAACDRERALERR